MPKKPGQKLVPAHANDTPAKLYCVAVPDWIDSKLSNDSAPPAAARNEASFV